MRYLRFKYTRVHLLNVSQDNNFAEKLTKCTVILSYWNSIKMYAVHFVESTSICNETVARMLFELCELKVLKL